MSILERLSNFRSESWSSKEFHRVTFTISY